ncbi:MAG TPA: hypothetical protein VHL58_14645 [Thermoanaerobaculia bacterium]|nr:hypothetical protein [Thermoanaerobaculia bacterium]
MGHYDIPLDLPHACTIAGRIIRLVQGRSNGATPALAIAENISTLLWPCSASGENPPEKESSRLTAAVAELARQLVTEIENEKIGDDRIGQLVRNLFECLELGKEGADLSLRAGENPNSLQRPM